MWWETSSNVVWCWRWCHQTLKLDPNVTFVAFKRLCISIIYQLIHEKGSSLILCYVESIHLTVLRHDTISWSGQRLENCRTSFWIKYGDHWELNSLMLQCLLLATMTGWPGGAKESCILRHQGVQLILAYRWAKPAILLAGKSRGGMLFFLLLFLLFLHFHSCSFFFPVPLFHLFYYLYYLVSPFLWKTTQNGPQELTCR